MNSTAVSRQHRDEIHRHNVNVGTYDVTSKSTECSVGASALKTIRGDNEIRNRSPVGRYRSQTRGSINLRPDPLPIMTGGMFTRHVRIVTPMSYRDTTIFETAHH